MKVKRVIVITFNSSFHASWRIFTHYTWGNFPSFSTLPNENDFQTLILDYFSCRWLEDSVSESSVAFKVLEMRHQIASCISHSNVNQDTGSGLHQRRRWKRGKEMTKGNEDVNLPWYKLYNPSANKGEREKWIQAEYTRVKTSALTNFRLLFSGPTIVIYDNRSVRSFFFFVYFSYILLLHLSPAYQSS